jgi:hypothetical protein
MTDCTTLFLQNLGTQEPPKLGSLRDMERTRLLRALYRFQIFQDLLDFHQTLRTRFLSIFDAWELEEVHCIDQLVRARHNSVCNPHITRMDTTAPKRKVDPKVMDCLSIQKEPSLTACRFCRPSLEWPTKGPSSICRRIMDGAYMIPFQKP